MADFGKKNPYNSANQKPQKKPPSRIDYSISTDKKPLNQRSAGQMPRVNYQYKGGEVLNAVTEVKLPLEAQIDTVQQKSKVFDQDTAPIAVKNGKKSSGGMQETIIPLGTINVPLTVIDGKKRTQPAQEKQPEKKNSMPPRRQPQKPQPKQRKTNEKQPPKARSAVEKKRPQPARQPSPPKKTTAKPLSYGDARRRRKKRNIIAAAAAAILIIAGIIVSVTVVFKIDTINVSGDSPYSSEEIISAFGYTYGDNLFKFKTADAVLDMTKKLPYLETVTVRRQLPGTVSIEVTQAAETYSMNTDSGWAVLSSAFKVLRIAAEPASGLTYLSGVTADAPTAGETINLTDSDQMSALKSVTQTLAVYAVSPVSEIDLSNLLEITFLYDNRIRVLIGTANDIDNKISYASDLITPEKLSDSLSANERGLLDVSGRNSEGRMVAIWSAGEP